ncbi:hypothetical protein BKI52_28030 [marine bacterium AO1-C]|nr:hypothetical protein BKI52_28030 [marine bacterium AO1-C]
MKLFCNIICLLLAWSSYGQDCLITGKVTDEKNKVVPYATVAFKSQKDSSKVFGTLTDNQGQFSLKLPRDRYTWEVSIVGSKPYKRILDLLKGPSKVDLGKISIQTTVTLDEVVVTADNSQYIELDKKVYNVSQEMLAGGGSLVDIMQNIPSVQVEVDGNISIRGNGNVRILIDGRNSGITNPQAFLRTIPAGSIERIEVITNPSSKYVAEGTGGIINVVLKKGKKRRLTSSFEVFSGARLNAGGNANISKGGEKLSWYFNTGVGYSEPKKLDEFDVVNFDNTPFETRQTGEKILKQFYWFNNLGGQWILNKSHRLNLDMTYRKANIRNENAIAYEDTHQNVILNQSQRLDTEISDNNLIRSSATYKWKLNPQGGELRFTLFGQSSIEDGSSNITEQSLVPVAQVSNIDRSLNEMQDRRYSLSVDYVQPLPGKAQIEIGGRHKTTQILNDFSVERTSNGATSQIPEFTDKTAYDETIQSFYAQYTKTQGKLKYQVGLRSETTNILISTVNRTQQQAIAYTNLFPSAFVHYDFNDQHKIRLSVSRRIRRPRLSALIPFSSFSDARRVRIGNPSVNPAFVIFSQLGYQGKFNKRLSITPTLFYYHTQNVLDYFIEKRSITVNGTTQDIFVRKTINIGERQQLGLEMGISYQVSSWLRLYTEGFVSGFIQTGGFQDVDYNSTGIISAGRFRFNFDLSKTLKLQLQHRFVGGNQRGQFTRRSVYRMDMGLSKQLFGKKATLSLNFKDVFNTWWFRIHSLEDTFRQDYRAQIRTPQANISFIYLLNQKKYQGKKGKQYEKY